MPDVTQLVAQIREELAGELRERVRERLGQQPTEWLVEQLMALALPATEVAHMIPRQVPRRPDAGETLPAHPARQDESGHERHDAGESEHARGEARESGHERRSAQDEDQAPPWSRSDHETDESEDDRAAHAARIRRLGLDQASMPRYVERYRALGREELQQEGHLLDPPDKGGPLISAAHRSPRGEALLREAKDLLHALLFGGEEDGVRLDRVQRESLTLTVPRAKAHAVAPLMRAATEIGAEGTWRDSERVADDDRAANILLQVEYGEVAGELVGNAVAATLRLINNLEINEQVLYGRTENVEESTLDP
ncbi:hypothetical protein [Sphaerisporangium perillae]|uniref:hypothetical protein n=1 Tax=Sphaerisporangium perillae TaxID=2935860 RepID=UPI00200C0278|nr:hypothetical protein [Sphaerisporangium perillae]